MIDVRELSKRYGATPVVRDVSFRCEPGTVTGFLGPNGAGKSTTLRMVTGLTRPDGGAATVDGRAYVSLPNPARVVGTLLDAGAMHPGRSGGETLRLAARVAGVPTERADEMLTQVGLAGSAAKKRVGTYSLGMRQRLGIAQALIGGPHVLILDEPANGLDPEGIAWMRRLLRDFADRGGTVLLSSHLLAEVQATADNVVVIGGGRVVAQGPLKDLLRSAEIIARATDPTALGLVLERAGVSYRTLDEGRVSIATADGTFDEVALARLAQENGVLLIEIRRNDGAGLEELFFSLTSSSDGTPTSTEVAA